MKYATYTSEPAIECPNCGEYQCYDKTYLYVHTEWADGWRKLLPWNWLGTMRTDSIEYRECNYCGWRG